MHPAPSLILFSTLSGMGFGLLAMLGRAWAPDGLAAFLWFALAFALAGGGLVASVFHLRRPDRAILAFTPGPHLLALARGGAAVATLGAHGRSSRSCASPGWRAAPLGWLGALLACATVACTAMIYAQMRTVPRWHHWTTPALFLALALGGRRHPRGGPLARPPAARRGRRPPGPQLAPRRHGLRAGGRRPPPRPPGSPGFVRSFAPPHTGPNYLTREMMFVVARRRAEQLRLATLVLGFILPMTILFLPALGRRSGRSPRPSTSRACSPRAGCSWPRPSTSSASTTAPDDRPSRRPTPPAPARAA